MAESKKLISIYTALYLDVSTLRAGGKVIRDKVRKSRETDHRHQGGGINTLAALLEEIAGMPDA